MHSVTASVSGRCITRRKNRFFDPRFSPTTWGRAATQAAVESKCASRTLTRRPSKRRSTPLRVLRRRVGKRRCRKRTSRAPCRASGWEGSTGSRGEQHREDAARRETAGVVCLWKPPLSPIAPAVSTRRQPPQRDVPVWQFALPSPHRFGGLRGTPEGERANVGARRKTDAPREGLGRGARRIGHDELAGSRGR